MPEKKHVDISHCPVKHGVSDGLRSTLLMVTEYLLVVILKKKHGVGSLYPPMLSSVDLNYVESFQLVHSSCYAHVENQIERVRALGTDYQL